MKKSYIFSGIVIIIVLFFVFLTFSPEEDTEWEESSFSFPSESTSSEEEKISQDEETPQEEENQEPTIPPPSFLVSYENVKPGEYGEVYADIQNQPNTIIIMTLTGPGVLSESTQFGSTDNSGKIRLIWQVNISGDYLVEGVIGGQPLSSDITVE